MPAVDHLEHHVALELVEELLDRIDMEVGALVRSADDLHCHVGVLENLLVADRRLEQVLVLRDPFLEVEGLESSGRHGAVSLPHAADARMHWPSSLSPQVSNARRV